MRGSFEYSSATLNAFFGQRRNLVRPRFWRMTRDLLRFYRSAAALAESGKAPDVTLGEYLDREGYSASFAEDHILPMSAAIWSTTPDEIRAYPFAAFLRFYASHGLLDLRARPQWRTVSGGSQEYVRRIIASLRDVRSAAGVRRVERSPAGVLVEDAKGNVERFSDVVVATHADEALALLSDADTEEKRILGAFRYTQNEAVLHQDHRLMPRRKRVWSSWNFVDSSEAGRGRQLSVTYWMNRLQNIDRRTPFFVTLNPHREPAPEMVLGRYSYSHPYYDGGALEAQNELWRLQAQRRTWFCGAYFGYGFHEDGIQAGLAVAEALGGVQRPWHWAPDQNRIAPASPRQEAEIAA